MQRLRHRRASLRHGVKRGRSTRPNPSRALSSLPRLRSADRKSLLLGTALASTPLLASLSVSTPAHAVACIQPASLNDNQATLVSTGTTFILKDDLQDVWGGVSAGVNFFNPSANTSVFAKLDVTFGDDIDGVGGKAGMRVSW
jgi:hypothetical protein